MMPFSGFMQIISGQQPFGGEKPNGLAKGGQDKAIGAQGILPLDGDSHSFLEWVRKLAATDLNGEMDNGDATGAIIDDVAADDSAMEALQALIGEAMGHCQPDFPTAQLPTSDSGNDDPASVHSETSDAFIDHADHSCPPHHTRVHQVLAAVQQMIDTRRQGEQAEGGPSLVAKTARTAAIMPDIGTDAQVERGDNSDAQNPTTPNPVDIAAKSQPAFRQIERAAAPLVMKPDQSSGEERKADSTRLTEPQPGVIGHQTVKPHAPETAASTAGESATRNDAVAMAAGLTDQQSDASTDDSTASRNAGKTIPGLKADDKDSHEVGRSDGPPSDPVKHASVDHSKSTESYQETARSVATDKPVVQSAAPIHRTDESAVKGFQNTVMEQIVEKASVRAIQGRSEIHIRLKPEVLGNVQMHVATDKSQLVVRVVTDQPVVKEIIEANLHQLKAELHHQGLTIDRFDVMVNPDADPQHQRESFAQMFKQSPMSSNRKDSREQDPETMNRRGGNHARGNQSDGEGVNYFA